MPSPKFCFIAAILALTSWVRAASISQSVSMPVVNQQVALTVSADLIGNTVSVAGPLGTSQLTPDAQGNVTWTPTRYGQYTITCGGATNTVWVTVKPMIFHWWSGDSQPQNATVVMTGQSSYWHSRGVKLVNWAGGEAYSRGVDGHYFTTAQDWLSNWSYAQAADGIAVDEVNAVGGSPSDQIVQAVGMIPQQWGPNYSLGVYFSSTGSGFSTDAGILKTANAYCMVEDYWGDYSLHVSRWAGIQQYGLQNQSVLDISPYFYISSSQQGPQTEAQVREQFRQVRLAAPEAPGIGFFNAYGNGLDAACDQAITDYFLKPVISLSVNASSQVVAWNIGNEIAAGFSLQFLDGSNNVLQTIDLSALAPNAQMAITPPGPAVTALVSNPSGTVNLYPNGLYSIPPPPGRYVYNNANGDNLWSTFSDWNPHGPPPGNIDSGNYAYFSGGGITVAAISGETSINSVQFVSPGWTINGNASSQDFFTYWIGSGGAGTNTVNIGYRTTTGVPATINVDAGNTLVMNGLVYGPGALAKQGAGILSLSYANSFTGATNISAGTLQMVGSGTLGGGTYAGTISNSGALNFAGSASQTLSGVISGTGNLTVSGSGTLYLSATNTLSGTVNLQSGTLNLNGGVSTIANATLNVTGGTLNFNGATAVRLGALSGTQGLSIAALTGSSGSDSGLILGGSNTSATYTGVLSGAGGLVTKVGTGTQILTGVNTCSGATTISGGILQIGNGGASGSLGSGNVIDNAALVFNRNAAANLTVANVISGTGSVAQNGTGTTILSGANTYTGSTLVNAGTLSIQGSVANTGSVSVANGATLNVTGQCNVSGNVVNSGTLQLTGAGVLNVTGTFTNNGIVDIMTGGTLPANFVNNGVVLDRTCVRIEDMSISGNDFTTTIGGYSGHGYQLQRANTLAGPWTNIGAAQSGLTQPDGTPAILTFTDVGGATGASGFYRIVVSP